MLLLKAVATAAFAVSISVPALLMAAPTTQAAAPTVFFVQTADKALLTSNQLILTSPNNRTTWFADAPSNATGLMPTNHYYNLLWGKPSSHFNLNNPNASLVGEVINPQTHQFKTVSIVVNLDRATLDNHQIIYHIHALPKQDTLLDLQKPVVLLHPTLFIDRYICPTCD